MNAPGMGDRVCSGYSMHASSHLGPVMPAVRCDLVLHGVALAMQVGTYLDPGSLAYKHLHHVELACCCWFAAEWLLHVWTANDRLRYMVSMQSVVYLLTVVPLCLTYILDAVGGGSRGAVRRPQPGLVHVPAAGC